MKAPDYKTNLHVVIEMLKLVPEEEFDMNYFAPQEREDEFVSCRTACCIAGNIVKTKALGDGWRWAYATVTVDGVDLDRGMGGAYPPELREVLENYFGPAAFGMNCLFWSTDLTKDEAIEHIEQLL